MIIAQFPDDASAAVGNSVARATGAVARNLIVPMMTSAEFKQFMEKAKGLTTTYTPPTATR
jgi:hypothetical protein